MTIYDKTYFDAFLLNVTIGFQQEQLGQSPTKIPKRQQKMTAPLELAFVYLVTYRSETLRIR